MILPINFLLDLFAFYTTWNCEYSVSSKYKNNVDLETFLNSKIDTMLTVILLHQSQVKKQSGKGREGKVMDE